MARIADLSALVDDRPQDKVFRLNRSVFTDPDIFEQEMEQIFARTWIYLCHASQVPAHGDYVTTTLGRTPVFVVRRKDGSLGGYVNSCTHRGTLLLSRHSGNARTMTCRYHGWAFNTGGECVVMRGAHEGYAPDALARMGTSLKPIPRFAAYKDFVFGCLDAKVEDLDAFLAPVAPFIDLLADQSPDGMEILKGDSCYVMEANWKIQSENTNDGYHVASLHRNFANTLRFRESLTNVTDELQKTEASRILSLEKIGSGTYDLGNGHMVNWSARGNPASMPLYESRERVMKEFPGGKGSWMINRGQTITVFPNLLLNDVASTDVRIWRPVAPDRTEIDTWCLAPRGESAAARRARIRKFEDFFLPGSIAVPDDVRAMEGVQSGNAGVHRPNGTGPNGSGRNGGVWNDYSYGRHTMVDGPDDAARELGFTPVSSNPGREGETGFYAFYREWRRRMDLPTRNRATAGGGARPARRSARREGV
jgi:benzoate/toluate 1,2-dioxygenase alpha subunit